MGLLQALNQCALLKFMHYSNSIKHYNMQYIITYWSVIQSIVRSRQSLMEMITIFVAHG